MKKTGCLENGPFNIAVVGLGWWGKTMIGLLKDSATVRVVKAVDANAATGEWAQSQGVDFTSDYSEALADPNIAGVILCTPHSLHTQQITAAAAAKKHVFCEKPLAMNRRDVLVSVGACKANGVVLAVGHEHRFKPVMIDVLRMVRSGELGTIQTTEATLTHDLRPLDAGNWRLQKSEAPGGTMTALGLHGLDLCVGVNGPAESVVATINSLVSATRDSVSAMVKFKSGATAVITSLMGPPFSIRFAVFGDKGWVEVCDKNYPAAPEGWILTKRVHGGKIESIEYPAMSMVRANVEAFAEAASGGATYPVTHEEMIANISAFEAICKACDSGQIELVEG
jgi:predicted dehydrogenase